MTDSEVVALRPPDNPPPGDEWKRVPGYPAYEWSHRGLVRSPSRPDGMSQRPNNSGYLIVNVVNDEGVKETVLVHRMILRAHAGEFLPGEESLHGPGGQQDNRFPENLRKDTHAVNVSERSAANPREPKPPASCINHDRCGGYVVRGGRRCHACRVELGRAAAVMFADGADPEQVARALNYGNANGVYRVAVQLGGLRCYVDQAAPSSPVTYRDREPLTRWLRRVINRARASRQISDAQ